MARASDNPSNVICVLLTLIDTHIDYYIFQIENSEFTHKQRKQKYQHIKNEGQFNKLEVTLFLFIRSDQSELNLSLREFLSALLLKKIKFAEIDASFICWILRSPQNEHANPLVMFRVQQTTDDLVKVKLKYSSSKGNIFIQTLNSSANFQYEFFILSLSIIFRTERKK